MKAAELGDSDLAVKFYSFINLTRPPRIVEMGKRWGAKIMTKVMNWVDGKRAVPTLAICAFLEGFLLPTIPDFLLVALGVRHPKKSFNYATVCLVGTVLGGMIGHALGFYVGDWLRIHWNPPLLVRLIDIVHANAFMTVFVGAYTPITFKLLAISSGIVGMPLPDFLLAAILGRGGRYFIQAMILMHLGSDAKHWLERNGAKLLGGIAFFLTAGAIAANQF